MDDQKRSRFNRRNFIRVTGMGAIGAFSYARWVEPRLLTVTERDIHIPRLPSALDGLRIAQLTDFHYQPEHQDQLMADAVATVNAANPDLICLTGDFITQSPDALAPLMEHLSRLRSKHGIYGIMGNHDGWSASPSLFQNHFRKAGLEFLLNQGSRINIGGAPLFIYGTDSIWSGRVHLPSCYGGHSPCDPVLALVHEPDVFDIIKRDHRVDLQLSGHTHGGQCRVPLLGYAPVKVRYGRNYIYGDYQVGDSSIFVSRGLGTVGTTVRFACAPEVAILTLRSEEIS
ncbi:metallophosphoesterase [Verrucomicrobiaceae bacterium N1E253]|uniref:Metallophosphoesterase n=1 Tax=Oceaniferula marina TaxID=2748318 RepID=A0A851GGK5_9BACT|nr:metallophosphoesterase [Oceaniferula marina]NWK56032.1 metallophosphoesterase [Oceaniferula marina]